MKRARRKKGKVKYNVLFVPDVATADVKKFSIKLGVLSRIAVVILLIISIALIYCYFLTNHMVEVNESMTVLRTERGELQAKIEELESENTQLQQKVLILSDTVNEKVKQEEERLAKEAMEYVPSGYPLKGTATFDTNEVDDNGNTILKFMGSEGTNVVAASKGVVESVSGNEADGFVVTVDHQNGYKSIYLNGSLPKVTEGDMVTRETVIYVMTPDHEGLGYQIVLDGQYIDPLEVMEIYG